MSSRTFYKEAVTRSNVGCLNCGAPPIILPSRACLAVGFGMVWVERDDQTLWAGDDEEMTALRWTRKANADPEHDWRIRFDGPMHGETYQHQDGKWIMVETNLGFA